MARQATKEEIAAKLKEWNEYERKVKEKGNAYRNELATIVKKPVYTKKDAERVAELVEEFAKVMHEMPAPLAD